MIKQFSKKTMWLAGSMLLITGMSLNAQASEIDSNIMISLEKTMAQQTAKLIEAAKKEAMLSFEAQLAEMMHELSIKAEAAEKSNDVNVAKTEQIEDQNDWDIE